MFKCTPVFYENHNSTAKIVINQGGTSSSKTYSIVQLLFLKAIEQKNIITITGESLPNLRKGAYRDAETILFNTKELKKYILAWNKSDRTITFHNGSTIEFISNTDEQSAKAGKRDYLFVNEADGVSWQIFWQMAIRTSKQIFLDYNPSRPTWPHERLIGTGPDTNDLSATVRLIISDHRHNTFLTKEEHAKIEGIKNKDLWWVYARGKTGNLEGLIYPDWKMIPTSEFPHGHPFTGGVDFGYTNDPSVAVKVVVIGNKIFIDELFYATGMSPKEIADMLKFEGFDESSPVFCDHDMDMIISMRQHGIAAMHAKKGQGSINAGISYLKGFQVFYTDRSKNIHEERGKYMWMKDKMTGKATNHPIEEFNHGMDACRYGTYGATLGQTV